MFILLTGLPCSGKSTIAAKLEDTIPSAIVLDGDKFRAQHADTDFSRVGRARNLLMATLEASPDLDLGYTTIAAFVSPYRDVRALMRAIIESLGHTFKEVFVYAPKEVCQARDVKGMWAKAAAGEITGFTGHDDPYEVPTTADLVVNTATMSVEECVTEIVRMVNQ